MPKQPVLVVAEDVVEAPLFRSALHAAGAGLVDLDVDDGGRGGVGVGGRRGRSGELLDVEGQGDGGDEFAGEVAHVLELEAGVDVGGEGLVLLRGVVSE